MLTVKEVCEIYGITRNTVYLWRNEGMPCKNFNNRSVFFNKEEVDKWVKKNKNRY